MNNPGSALGLESRSKVLVQVGWEHVVLGLGSGHLPSPNKETFWFRPWQVSDKGWIL